MGDRVIAKFMDIGEIVEREARFIHRLLMPGEFQPCFVQFEDGSRRWVNSVKRP